LWVAIWAKYGKEDPNTPQKFKFSPEFWKQVILTNPKMRKQCPYEQVKFDPDVMQKSREEGAIGMTTPPPKYEEYPDYTVLQPKRTQASPNKKTWYKTTQEEISGYPYYVAVYSEGRLKGQAPMEIRFVPNLRKKWDAGGFGTGKRTKEFKSTDIKGLLNQLNMARIHPVHDDVDFYIVRLPNGPREKIPYSRLQDITRN